MPGVTPAALASGCRDSRLCAAREAVKGSNPLAGPGYGRRNGRRTAPFTVGAPEPRKEYVMARTTTRTTKEQRKQSARSAKVAKKDERRESARALKAAKKANAEARKLASSLPQPTRGRLEAVAAEERTQLDRVRKVRGVNPRTVARRARRSAVRLERASAKLGPRKERRSASSDPKQRAGSIKRQRVQAKKSQALPTKAAIRTLITAVLTPTDAKQREKVAKRRVRQM